LNQADTAPEPQSADANNHTARDAAHADFAATRPDEGLEPAVDWWPESADGQCSESAALFATSQSAPLNVV
jgi:hypothetical protein